MVGVGAAAVRGLARPLFGAAQVFGHEHAVVAGLGAAAGFDKAEPGIERDVFDHRAVRIEPQLVEAEPPRLGRREIAKCPAIASSLAIRSHRDVV